MLIFHLGEDYSPTRQTHIIDLFILYSYLFQLHLNLSHWHSLLPHNQNKVCLALIPQIMNFGYDQLTLHTYYHLITQYSKSYHKSIQMHLL